MEVLHSHCAGLDVHKESVVACVRHMVEGKVTNSVKSFKTTTQELMALSDFWIVTCKNQQFHEHENKWFGHRILLGEADAYSSPPVAQQSVRVVCDACGKECEYHRKEILRDEDNPAPGFVEHPLSHEAWV